MIPSASINSDVKERLITKNKKTCELSLEDAIDIAGNGLFQVRLLFICGLGWISDAFEMMLIGFIIPVLTKEWNLSAPQAGLLATIVLFGMLLGAAVWSFLGDLIGRRFSFMMTVVFTSVFGVISAFSPNYPSLLFFRCLVGFGLGGNLPIDYSMFMEYLATERRGLFAVMLSTFFPIGVMMSSALAAVVMPGLGWRWLLALSAIPGFFVMFFRPFIPESPRYLLLVGKSEEAWKVVTMVVKVNGKRLPTNFKPLNTVAPKLKRVNVDLLFTDQYRRATFLLWGIWFCSSMGYFGVATWLPDYMLILGIESEQIYQNFILFGFGQLIGLLLAAVLIDRIGRKATISSFFLTTGLGGLAFGLSIYWRSSLATDTLNILVLIFSLSINFTSSGASGAMYTFTPEVFPTIVRSTGVGTCSMMNRLGGMAAPLIGSMLLTLPLSVSFMFWAAVYVVAGMFVFLLPFDTTQQKMDAPVTAVVPELLSSSDRTQHYQWI